MAFYSWTHTRDGKKGDSEGEGLPLISLGSLDQERRPHESPPSAFGALRLSCWRESGRELGMGTMDPT